MKFILILSISLFLNGCATIPENEEQFLYLLGSELQYHLDNEAWIKKYGDPKEVEKDTKSFPYAEVEKEGVNTPRVNNPK